MTKSFTIHDLPKDFLLTKKLKESGKILGIKVADHIIVAKDKLFSFKEKN